MQNTKQGIASALAGDATLIALLGGSAIYFHRPAIDDAFKTPGVVGVVTFFLMTSSEAPDVPLLDETYQIDIWSKSGDLNDQIAARVRALLHKQPLTLPSGRLANTLIGGPGTELYEDDTRIHHRVLQLRVLSYP